MARDYDIIIIGGGLGGAALARVLADKGIHVLVLEREVVFRDRVRGELMHPWGVSEARALGLYELLKQTCGHEVRFRDNQVIGLPPAKPRDLVTTSPHQAGSLHFYHPEMQEVLLRAAADAGAAVQRGTAATDVSPGAVPTVRVETNERAYTYQTRLVIGADGRASACRKWANLEIHRDQKRMMIAGVLFNGLSTPDDAYHAFVNPPRGEVAFQIPLGRERFRCYYSFYQQEGRRRFSGQEAAAGFIEVSAAAGAPREWFDGAKLGGPLASFDCAEVWIDHPYHAGVVLIGDAAATSDPTFGCGLSLTLRDVHTLSNLLLTEDNWEAAAHAYAAEHDRYFGSLHTILDWMTRLFYEPGPEASLRREKAFARLIEDPRRAPDIAGLGPESPNDEAAYRNLFGEE